MTKVCSYIHVADATIIGLITIVYSVLEWISIYWFSRSGPAASLRVYYEMSHGGTDQLNMAAGWTSVPLGVSYFPAEVIKFPK